MRRTRNWTTLATVAVGLFPRPAPRSCAPMSASSVVQGLLPVPHGQSATPTRGCSVLDHTQHAATGTAVNSGAWSGWSPPRRPPGVQPAQLCPQVCWRSSRRMRLVQCVLAGRRPIPSVVDHWLWRWRVQCRWFVSRAHVATALGERHVVRVVEHSRCPGVLPRPRPIPSDARDSHRVFTLRDDRSVNVPQHPAQVIEECPESCV